MSTNDPQAFGAVVKARREELGLSQLDVWQSGGPSNTTLTTIENGRAAKLPPATAKKLDAALLWRPGSALRLWREGAPPVPFNKDKRFTDLSWADDLDEKAARGVLALLDGFEDRLSQIETNMTELQQLLLEHFETEGGEADGDAAPTKEPDSGPGTLTSATVRNLPTLGQGKPSLSSFDEDDEAAARSEDTEPPRLGDE